MTQFEFENGIIYQGEHLNGQRHGWGRQTFPDGSYYEGLWQYNVPHGKGTFV